MQSLKIGSSSSRNKLAAASPPTSLDHALLQPDGLAEGDTTKVHSGKVPAQVQKMHIPRTRDDSSDEDDRDPPLMPQKGVLPTPPPMGGNIHMPPHLFPGSGNFPPPPRHLIPHHHHMPPHHMMQPPHLRGSPGVPEHFQARGARGLIGPGPHPPPPPHAMGTMGQGLLPRQPHPQMVGLFMSLIVQVFLLLVITLSESQTPS